MCAVMILMMMIMQAHAGMDLDDENDYHDGYANFFYAGDTQ